MTQTTRKWAGVAFGVLLLPLGGCEGFFDVESPGRIADEDLNDVEAFPALVAGMSRSLTDAYDDMANATLPIVADELYHGGSYAITDIAKGIVLPEDVNGEWGSMHEARWVAESGIERMRGVYTEDEFASSALVAEAYLWAGLSNRLLGENVCAAVLDGGEEQPFSVHFQRGLDQFTQAIEIGGRAGEDDIVTAAYGGRAAMKAWLGDWAGAVQDAQEVPVDFVWDVLFNTGAGNGNQLYIETHDRFEYTVFNTIYEAHPNDPRVPWDTVFNADGSIANGANGTTPHYQQVKYTSEDSDDPAVKGTGMLVLRAEAALRNDDIPGAYLLMNEARDFYGMAPLTPAASIEDAWDDLQFERGATLWLEARRLWDLRRWFAAGPGSPEYHPFLEDRATCIPISEEEVDSNPNI
ncbi:MAG: RagB/SusD family nutrient uptake outer membrane protein [Longimicrobiales bacterium]